MSKLFYSSESGVTSQLPGCKPRQERPLVAQIAAALFAASPGLLRVGPTGFSNECLCGRADHKEGPEAQTLSAQSETERTTSSDEVTPSVPNWWITITRWTVIRQLPDGLFSCQILRARQNRPLR
jgi:hypothetical protein